ncbi:MAG: 4-alpha-glucanotransferase [Bacilli bacterium]|nr:4-alpha-glucanotransferase [Bacilli bacterium]
MKKGILLPIFSLPSKYGIGDFGYEAYEFIDILSSNNIDYWEILPINDDIGSPYSPISYYALNRNYVSLDKLKEMNLINKPQTKATTPRIVYDNFKEKYYFEAYNNFKGNDEYLEFIKNEEIIKYALFMQEKTNIEKEYFLFLQYILDKQWNELKEYAHSKNVKIIGDLPIYPDYNSVEVKYYPQYYQLNNDNKMEYVSGASPDYFNSEGQKWGHPLYNFDEMKKNNYEYLIKRYQEFLNKYDLIRIDHFRAFDTYFKIPVNGSAKEGIYVEGPGKNFFNQLFKITSSDKFIIEDLGDLRKETFELKDYYNFKGMKIIQYTLNPKEKKDEYNDVENMVIYTGNHDNNTIVGWYNSISKLDQINIKEFLKEQNCYDEDIHISFIKYILKSKADLAIIPVQDIIGLDENSRVNLPGTVDNSNWSWQLKNFEEFKNNITILNETIKQ